VSCNTPTPRVSCNTPTQRVSCNTARRRGFALRRHAPVGVGARGVGARDETRLVCCCVSRHDIVEMEQQTRQEHDLVEMEQQTRHDIVEMEQQTRHDIVEMEQQTRHDHTVMSTHTPTCTCTRVKFRTRERTIAYECRGERMRGWCTPNHACTLKL